MSKKKSKGKDNGRADLEVLRELTEAEQRLLAPHLQRLVAARQEKDNAEATINTMLQLIEPQYGEDGVVFQNNRFMRIGGDRGDS